MVKYALFLHDLGLTNDETRQLLDQTGCGHAPLWASDARVKSLLNEIEVLVTANHTVNASVIADWPGLKPKMLSLAFTGYDHVDREWCESDGLSVYYVPGYSTPSVAELTVCLTLSVLRRLPRADASAREGRWDWNGIQPGVELWRKTVGILGVGNIGLATAKRFLAFDCKVIGWNRSAREELNEFVKLGSERRDTPEQVFAEADVVVVHLASNDETKHFVNRTRLSLMKPTSVLINTARGELVDTTALVDALRQNRIAGAGIDVFEKEPVLETDALLKLDNVVATPHLGFKTKEALRRLAEDTIGNIGRWVRKDPCNRLLPKTRA